MSPKAPPAQIETGGIPIPVRVVPTAKTSIRPVVTGCGWVRLPGHSRQSPRSSARSPRSTRSSQAAVDIARAAWLAQRQKVQTIESTLALIPAQRAGLEESAAAARLAAADASAFAADPTAMTKVLRGLELGAESGSISATTLCAGLAGSTG